MKDFIEELKWRGMLHDVIPGTEEHLEKNKTIGYIGFDPTSDSLHIGSLVPIFILKHFQNSGSYTNSFIRRCNWNDRRPLW